MSVVLTGFVTGKLTLPVNALTEEHPSFAQLYIDKFATVNGWFVTLSNILYGTTASAATKGTTNINTNNAKRNFFIVHL